MSKFTRTRQNERGQSMVELALTITILMVLLAGTVDLGRAFFTWLALRDAAQEGASYGSYRPDDIGGIQARVWDNLEQVISSPSTMVDVNSAAIPSACVGNTITVDVDYPSFPITMPLLGSILGSQQIDIHASISDTILSPKCN